MPIARTSKQLWHPARLRIVTALVVVLVACAPPPPVTPAPPPAPPAAPVAEPLPTPSASPAPPPPPPPRTELSLATHRSFFDALRSHDGAALAALYAADAVVDIGVGGVGGVGAHNPTEVAALASSLFTAFPDSRAQWGTLLQTGDKLAVELAWTGTETAALRDLPATNKVVGVRGLLVERFDSAGLIASQRLYVDTATFVADVSTRAGKAHAFDGLPTRQTSVLDHAAAAPADDVALKAVVAAFRDGRLGDARPLAGEATSWMDVEKGHGVSGRGAMQAWGSFLEHAYGGHRGAPAGERDASGLVDAWSTGSWLVLEWSGAGRPGVAEAHGADLVRFEGGRIAEVRTYRGTAGGRGAVRR